MLKKLILVVLIILTAFVGGGIFLPREYHVERSIVVDQPASVLFTLLNSYRTFNNWSPWAARDPDAEFRFSGPGSGPGAKLSWRGDPRTVGEGWQQIIESQPYKRVEMYLDFGDQGTAQSYFDLIETDAGTRVTWALDTDISKGKGVLATLAGKYFGLFLDKWIGADYEQGLTGFKEFAETLPATDFGDATIEIVGVEALNILYVSGASSQEASDVAQALAVAFTEISDFIAGNDIKMAGQPMAITRSWDENGFQFDAALPVDKMPGTLSGNVQMGLSPAGRSVRYTHHGPYDQMLHAYNELASFMAANGLQEGPVSWEHYISDPGNTPEDEIITHIYFLILD